MGGFKRIFCKFLLKLVFFYIIITLVECEKGGLAMINKNLIMKFMAIFLNISIILSFASFTLAAGIFNDTEMHTKDDGETSQVEDDDSARNGPVAIPEDVVITLTKVTRILLIIGSAVCIGKIIHIGILFVTSSAVDKSNAKQALFPWLIGAFICFGAATIGSAIINIFMGAFGERVPNVLEY